jgi:hypothetical protein
MQNSPPSCLLNHNGRCSHATAQRFFMPNRLCVLHPTHGDCRVKECAYRMPGRFERIQPPERSS